MRHQYQGTVCIGKPNDFNIQTASVLLSDGSQCFVYNKTPYCFEGLHNSTVQFTANDDGSFPKNVTVINW